MRHLLLWRAAVGGVHAGAAAPAQHARHYREGGAGGHPPAVRRLHQGGPFQPAHSKAGPAGPHGELS